MIASRLAEARDQPDLDRLRRLARDETRDKKGGPLLVAEIDAAHDQVGDEAAQPPTVVVGTILDAVVGYAALTHTGGVALLEELYCEPGARGVGVGDELLQRAAAVATGWGCSHLDSLALPGDRETKNFFEAHGMVSRLLRVSRALEQ